MRWCWSMAVVVMAGLCLTEGRARAEAPGVLVPSPRVEGPAPGPLLEALDAGIRGGLADAGVEVAAASEGCTDATCMAAEVLAGHARAYVTTEVRVTGSDYALVVDILDGSGASRAHQEGTCEICSFEEVAASMRELVAKAAGELGPPAASSGTLRVNSDPAGATVTLDGVAVGTTPYEGEVDPGTHAVELTLDGRQPAQQRIDVLGGGTSVVDLPLARRSGLAPRTTELVGWVAIGVGVAALAGGITMLVLDENPVRSNCSGTHVDADGDCEFRYDTLGGGVGLTVTGVVVAGGGAGLVVYSRKRQGPRGAAEVAVGPGGLRARF
ncbi:MAG: PEGA domain-containing protein [Myxococcales bacterium]|nr:PEGA domain-containing protein [Myxococcales bacterium]